MPMVTDHMDTQLMVTTERDLLMLSQRLMLMLSMESTDTLPTDHMPTVPTDHMLTPPDGDMERDLLMLKPRLTQLSSTPVLSQLSLRRQLPPRLCLDPSCHPQDCPYPSHLHPRCRRPCCYLCWCPRCPHPSCQHSWIHSLLWKERGRG